MTGTGWGRGYPNLVPFADSDFIFAALGEELGLVGDFAIVLLFAVLIERFLRTAVAGRDAFGTLMSAGFAIILGLQTFLVMGGVTKLIPHTGLTTPFMSAGGSSLLANWIIVGLVLRISNAARRPVVVDAMVNASGPGAGHLDPGESLTCTASYTIAQADLNSGSVTNVAQAAAGGTVSNTDQETVTQQLSLVLPVGRG